MKNENGAEAFKKTNFEKNKSIVLDYLRTAPGSTARELAVIIEDFGENIFKESVSGTLSMLWQEGLVGRFKDSRKCSISGHKASVFEVYNKAHEESYKFYEPEETVQKGYVVSRDEYLLIQALKNSALDSELKMDLAHEIFKKMRDENCFIAEESEKLSLLVD